MANLRIRELDALRSFALLGILMVNVWYFADPWALSGSTSPTLEEPDTLVRFLVTLLFEAKFYLLFSFLFGYSFVLQWASAADSPAPVVPRTLRRLGFLAVLGILHGLFLFYGDILLTYAVLGCILLATRAAVPRTALAAGIILTAAFALLFLLATLGMILTSLADPASPEFRAIPGVGTPATTPAAALQDNADTYLRILPSVLFFQGPLALAALYAGLAAGKARLLERGIPGRVLRGTILACLPLGLAGATVQAYLIHYSDGDTSTTLATAISVATSPLLTVSYAAALLLAFRARSGRIILQFLEPAGRMALTNYLAQSVVLSLVFTGYGLRLTDRVPTLLVVLLVVVVFAVLLLLSRWWLSHFPQGPVEWALRRVTYWKEIPQAWDA
ncbi:DUF418 domain-containing protein [Arthrobacter sp. Br18]|uniref:DUF418 domain-containing protein n=1 Tax=Arthrobacter sp. Br18 TaxID=1312954 RepID=UPI0004B43909|nr:DUF418 domain-containing protein [Arthrobacter sp. Br18]